MSSYNFDAAAHMFACMDNEQLSAARETNIIRRDVLDLAARDADNKRAAALSAMKAAIAAYEEAERIALDAERAYSYAADDCCMGANEAYARLQRARATISALS